mmetsp:Transcript_10824/g.40431  ORF Transcript_10824/g.40431 Transcript_10824/m.40431 type:complete len:1068 (+) Transcript_10824:167-3370(+)
MAFITALLSTSAVLLFTIKLVSMVFGRKKKLIPLQSLIDKPEYNVRNISSPRLSGFMLKVVVEFMELDVWPVNRIPAMIMKKSGFNRLRELDITSPMSTVPIPRKYQYENRDDQEAMQKERDQFLKEVQSYWEKMGSRQGSSESPVFTSIQQYYTAYMKGSVTPLDVARNIIDIHKKKEDACNGIMEFRADLLLEEAEASTKRYKNKKPLSVLDGVPFVVKDCVDVAGFYTRFGTKHKAFSTKTISTDSPSVSRLRKAGAMMAAKTIMAEIGMDARSLNPHFGYTKNPYNLKHEAGGSSSGSAALVGANLVPFAIGTDGGSSIRNPSALCGCYGLKPTHARVPQAQQSKPGTFTVTVTGPIATDAVSLALSYATMAGPDSPDHQSTCQPSSLGLSSLKLNDSNFFSLEGVKIGMDRTYFNHVFDPEIAKQVEAFLDKEVCGHYRAGKVSDLKLPLLEELRVAHLLTISTEARSGYHKEMTESMNLFSHGTRLTMLAITSKLGLDYVNAQRLRHAAMKIYDEIFDKVDCIVMPTVAMTAPLLPRSARYGESDLKISGHLMRFAFLANFLGLPAVTIPIGNSKGTSLPVGIQFMSRWWCEDILLKLAILCQQRIQPEKPQVHYNTLRSPIDEMIRREQQITQELNEKRQKKLSGTQQPVVEIQSQASVDKKQQKKKEQTFPRREPQVDSSPASPEQLSIPSTPADETRARSKQKRLYAMAEFLSTERVYVRNLMLLQERFGLPLGKVLADKEHRTLFGQIEVIINTNTLFLSDLESVLVNDKSQDEQEEALADLLLRNAAMFKLYSPYISQYNEINRLANTLTKKNPKFQEICNSASKELKKEKHTLYTFFGLMITPIQRLPRLRLLLQEILKNTPADTPHYKKLEQATAQISAIATYCNEKTRENENMGRLLELEKTLKLNLVQPSRKFLVENASLTRTRGSGKAAKCKAYLFNDLLVVMDSKSNTLSAFSNVLGLQSTKQIPLDSECNTSLLPMDGSKTIVLKYETQIPKKKSRRSINASPLKDQSISEIAQQAEDGLFVFKNLKLNFPTEKEADEWNNRIKEILSQ